MKMSGSLTLRFLRSGYGFSAKRFGLSSTTAINPANLSPRLHGLGVTGTRNLFTLEATGVEAYEKQRNRTQTQFTGMIDKFREKMREFTLSDSKNMIFTEDLKNMVHIIENRPDDLTLIHQMMKRFNQQNKHLRFGNFVFGPVVMRMYHYLNQPTHALEAFKDPELEGFFEQMASFQVLCDLLYRNQMYQEILDVFEIVKSKQVQGQKFPRNVSILVFAACYKMNTTQSYEYALQMLNDMKAFGVEPVRRCIAFAAALAIAQNAPQVAIEILTNTRTTNYVTIRNLKMSALADMNRPDDCLPILRYSIEFDSPEEVKRQSVCTDVLEKIMHSVDRLGNKEVSLEFERINKTLVETQQVTSETLNKMLETEVAASQPMSRNGEGQQRREMIDRSFRIGRSNELRPQRSPAYQRDLRQSIKYE